MAAGLGQSTYNGGLRAPSSMAASRLSDSQKQELVQRYRQGESSTELAAAFGCSPNTVSRTVKAALAPAEYEQLKQRGRSGQAAQVAAPAANDDPPSLQEPAAAEATPAAPTATDDVGEDSSLAIDDADDFGDEDGGDESDDDDLIVDDFGTDDTFTPIAVLPLVVSHEPVQVKPLETSVLPESLYMLVDKTVELQPKPLRDFTELGQIPSDEEERQALQLFANPRQAKRHCGRTQRVIKMPDPDVFVRQASYLHVKGISRLVVEGTLYALPGGS